jgi:pimeloyl-ACP methyl ester carboxylesterase
LSRLFHPTKPNPVIDITTRLPTVAQIVIFIHGLHSHPFSSFKLVEELKDRFEEPWQNRILILAPPLHAKGNGPLSETVDHLWTYLKPLFEVYGPAYPVTLIGTSLGGLIALELRLRLESRRRVFVVSIAAPLIGTMGINLLQWIQSYGPKRLTIWSTLLRKHPALQQDLAFEAPLRYQLLQTLLDPAYQATTHYVFVATTNDQLILPFNASIPSLPHSTHLVTSLSNHIGVQVEMASQVIKTLMNLWISVDADKHV